jgi:DHA1 family bicyclomycin/chloramphenicol resistance-like MFS transporter
LLVVYGFIGISVGVLLVTTSGTGGFWSAQILFGLMLFNFGSTITSIQTIALLNHGEEAGTAAGLLGVSNFTFTSVFSLLYGFILTTETFGAGIAIASFYVLALMALLFIARPHKIQRFS